ncbi:MarR family transcriptional regulator [soil metagenome]
MPESDWLPMRTLGHYVSRVARGLARIGDRRLAALGFATAQLPVLSALRDGEKRSQAELMRWAKVEQPTMTQLIARMERDGLVRREPDPADKRSNLISLTETALENLPAGRAVLRQGNAEALRGFTDDEVATLLGLLERVLVNVEAMEG